VDQVAWTNIGKGWIIQCLCGFGTSPAKLMEDSGGNSMTI